MRILERKRFSAKAKRSEHTVQFAWPDCSVVSGIVLLTRIAATERSTNRHWAGSSRILPRAQQIIGQLSSGDRATRTMCSDLEGAAHRTLPHRNVIGHHRVG